MKRLKIKHILVFAEIVFIHFARYVLIIIIIIIIFYKGCSGAALVFGQSAFPRSSRRRRRRRRRSVNSRQRRWRRLVGGDVAGRGCNNPGNVKQWSRAPETVAMYRIRVLYMDIMYSALPFTVPAVFSTRIKDRYLFPIVQTIQW